MNKESSAVPEIGYVGKGTSYNFLGAISRSLLGFLYVYALAKILSVDEMGLFFLGVNIITFATIVAIGGMDVGLRRFIAISESNKNAHTAWEYFLTAIAVSLGLCLLLGVGLYFSSDVLSVRVFEKEQLAVVIKSLIPFLVFYALAELLLSVTQGYRHMKYWVLCLDVANTLLRMVFAIGLSFVGLTLFAAVIGYVLSIFIAVVMAAYFFIKIMPPRTTEKVVYRVREMVAFSFPVALARLVNSGNGILETLLLGYFLAASEVGIYTVAIKVAAMGTIVLASFNTMFSPIISKLQHEGKAGELKKLFSCVTRWTFTISMPVFLLIAWFAVSISAMFGEEYIPAANCIVVLCLGQIVNSVTGPSGNLLLMSGYTYVNLWTNLSGLVMSVVLNILLVPVYGIVGSALAVGIAITIVNMIRIVLAWKIMGMHPYETSYWKPLAAAGLMVMALILVGPHREEVVGIATLLLAGVLSALFYGVLLFMFGLDESDQYVLSRIKSRLK